MNDIGDPAERRGTSRQEKIFRLAVDRMLEVSVTIGLRSPSEAVDEIRRIARAAQRLLTPENKLAHKMRNIATVASLSDVVAAEEALEMIKGIIRSDPDKYSEK